jgi:hypothetical protein
MFVWRWDDVLHGCTFCVAAPECLAWGKETAGKRGEKEIKEVDDVAAVNIF